MKVDFAKLFGASLTYIQQGVMCYPASCKHDSLSHGTSIPMVGYTAVAVWLPLPAKTHQQQCPFTCMACMRQAKDSHVDFPDVLRSWTCCSLSFVSGIHWNVMGTCPSRQGAD